MSLNVIRVGVITLLLLQACSKPEITEQHVAPLPVRLVQVGLDGNAHSRHFVGRIDAVSTVDLAFQVSGRLAELPVQQGQVLAAGSLVAALDPADFQLAVQQAEVQLEQARRELERGEPLRERGILTPSAFDQLKTNFEMATGALQNAQRNLNYTRLTAPFDALVTRRLVERYSTLSAGMPILRVQDVTELRVLINVPEQVMRLVQESDDYRVSLQLSENDTRRFELSYREHSTEVDPLTQTYQVSFGMPRLDDINLLPGMTVNVLTERRLAEQTLLLIPITALDTSVPDQFSVWRYSPDTQQVQPVVVEVGNVSQDQVQILAGIALGEQIVSAGIYHLQPGQKVRPFTQY